MIDLLIQIIVALTAVYVSYRTSQRYNLKRKLWWVKTVPGYPILGNALDFQEPTKTLGVMKKHLTECNGLCFLELGVEPHLLASDTNFLKWLLSSSSTINKGDVYQVLNKWLGGGILISAGEQWRTSRKILTPAFHFSILEQFIEVFEDTTNVLIEILSKEVNKKEVDIHPILANYTLDVVCQTSMGVQLNVQKQPHSDYVEAVAGMGKIVVERAFKMLKMSQLTYMFTADYWREMKFVKLLHAVSDGVINKRRKEIKYQQDLMCDDLGVKRKMAFLDLLLKYRDENGNPLSDEFIRDQVDTVMFAGHDTTAAALGFAMYLLANHPDVQAKALTEIKEILGGKPKIYNRDLQELNYLDLIIKETLRLYPPVPFYSRKITEDLVYEEDKIVPKGLTVIVAAHTVNRDPSVYKDPDEFIPTRFLDNEPKPFSNLPFSAGPRNCIGQKFATLEMKIALAIILRNFELLPTDPPCDLVIEALTVLKARDGVKIRLKKRTAQEV